MAKRFSDERYELYVKEDGSVDVSLDEKRIREGCRRR